MCAGGRLGLCGGQARSAVGRLGVCGGQARCVRWAG